MVYLNSFLASDVVVYLLIYRYCLKPIYLMLYGLGLHGLPAGERGNWFSSNASVIRVDSNNGEARAVAEGVATGTAFSTILS